MKFGKEFKTHLEETLPEWRDKFLCYKPLKKLLKHFPYSSSTSTTTTTSKALDDEFLSLFHQYPILQRHVSSATVGGGGGGGGGLASSLRTLVCLQEWFVRILNEELDKFNDFYVDKEEDFVIRFQELRERIEHLKEERGKDGAFSAESGFSEEMMDIRRDLVTIHGEMVLLKNYSSLNFAGLVKILKKYDKRTGGLLRLPFTQLAVHQPFLTTEPLTRLVHECEENLELLFPLQEEVIESTNPAEGPSNTPSNNAVSDTSPNLAQETVHIYRSTLAAMKAIRGLQKASSTYDPLSFSSLIKSREDEGAGAITAENSPANLTDEHEAGDEDRHSV